jgi:phage gpG-like protein
VQVIIRIADEEKVIKVLDDVEGRAGDLSEPLADFGERMVRRISKRLSGDVLDARTGRLKGSLTHEETDDSLEISAGGGPGEVDYARIHHYGGTIRPKKKKALTIPFPGGPADKRVPLRARDFRDTFIAEGIIFRKLGDEKIEPLFILAKSVTIPASPYMYLEDSDVDYLNQSIADFIAGAWA